MYVHACIYVGIHALAALLLVQYLKRFQIFENPVPAQTES